MEKEYLSIKQIAEKLKVSKQRVYRCIKKNCIKEAHSETVNGNTVLMYDETAFSVILDLLSGGSGSASTETHEAHHEPHHEVHSDTLNEALYEALLKQLEEKKLRIESLEKQLAEKDAKIEELHEKMDEKNKQTESKLFEVLQKSQQLTEESQQLQIVGQQLQGLLTMNQKKEAVVSDPDEQPKKRWWQFWQ